MEVMLSLRRQTLKLLVRTSVPFPNFNTSLTIHLFVS